MRMIISSLFYLLMCVTAFGGNAQIFFSQSSKPTLIPETHYLNFDGVDEAVVFSNVPKVYPGTKWTVMCFSNAAASDTQVLFSQWDTVTPARSWLIGMPVSGSGLLQGLSSENDTASTAKNYSSTAAQFDGNWHQFASVHDADSNQYRLVVDGATVAVTTTTDDNVTNINDGSNASSFYIGRQESGRYLAGGVTQCALWQDSLTDAELTVIYDEFDPVTNKVALNLRKNFGNYQSAEDLSFWAKLGEGDSVSASGIKDSATTPINGSTQNMESGDIVAH